MSKYRARRTRLKKHILPPQQQTDTHKLKRYQKRFIKEVKSTLEIESYFLALLASGVFVANSC